MAAPVEAKVYAALAGGGIGGALGSFLLWVLGVSVWHVPSSADHAAAASAAVPSPVADLILILLPAGLAWTGGWLAPHSHRPDLTWSAPASAPLPRGTTFISEPVAPPVPAPATPAGTPPTDFDG